MPVLASAQTVLTPEQQLEKARQEARAAKKAVAEAKAAAKKAAKEAKKQQKNKAASAAEAKKNAEIERQIEAAKAEKARYEAERKAIEATKQAAMEQPTLQHEANAESPKASGNSPSTNGESPEQHRITVDAEWDTPTSDLHNVQIARAAGPAIPKNDPRYLAGKVPQDADGRVVFSINYDIKGKTAAEIQQRIAAVFAWLATRDGQLNSRVVLNDDAQHTVAAVFNEWLVFSQSYLSLDRTQFSYTLIAKCSDGQLALSMERISYDYERNRPAHLATTAEEWITDKVALNKKKDKLVNGPAKFRRATIDRMNSLFIDIYDLMR